LKAHPDRVLRQSGEDEQTFLRRKDMKKKETCLVVHSRNVLVSYIQNRRKSHWTKIKTKLREMWTWNSETQGNASLGM